MPSCHRQEISGLLEESLRLLVGGGSEDPRHRTLRATIEWSAHALAAADRALLEAMSGFRGSFDLRAVREVCAPDADEFTIVDRVSTLVRRSLVQVVPGAGETSRYRLLEPIRQWARGQVEEASWRELADRHLASFRARVEELEASNFGGRERDGYAEIDEARADIESALRHSEGAGGAVSDGVRLAAALPRYWALRGQFETGTRFLEAQRRRAGEATSVAGARIAVGLGTLALMQGRFAVARRWYELAYDEATEIGEPLHRARALTGLGSICMHEAKYDMALEHFERSLELQRREAPGTGLSAILNNIGAAGWRAGRFELARRALDQAILGALQRGSSDIVVLARINQEMIELSTGGAAARAAHVIELAESLQRLRAEAHAPSVLDVIGAVLSVGGDAASAQGAFGASRALRERLHRPPDPAWSRVIDPFRDAARRELGARAARELEEEGALPHWSDALDRATESLLRART